MKTYHTRVSIGLVTFVSAVILACAALPNIMGDDVPIPYYIILALVLIFVLWVICSFKYTIDGTNLIVSQSFSPFRPSVYDLTRLVSVAPSGNLISAPAGSTKRLCLTFTDGDELLISPRQQEDFLTELRKVNPKVKIDESLLPA